MTEKKSLFAGMLGMTQSSEHPIKLNFEGKYMTYYDVRVPCGTAREYDATRPRYIPLRSHFRLSTDEAFAWSVTGDSMIGAGIDEDDEVLVDPCRMPSDRDIVLAHIGYSYTVKTFFRDPETGDIVLFPENDKYVPHRYTKADNIEIVGVVVRTARSPYRKTGKEMEECIKRYKRDERWLDIVKRMAEAGYMTADGQWLGHVPQDFKAEWVDQLCEAQGIEDKWGWAKEKFGLTNLRQYLYRLQGTERWETVHNEVAALIAQED